MLLIFSDEDTPCLEFLQKHANLYVPDNGTQALDHFVHQFQAPFQILKWFNISEYVFQLNKMPY